MDGSKLVKMANQIAAFFAAEQDRKVAIENFAGHLKRCWDPRMRREFLALFDTGGDHGMSELVVAALKTHRATLEPTSQ